MELVPLDLDIDNIDRKDLSSIPISQIDFPEIVYIDNFADNSLKSPII